MLFVLFTSSLVLSENTDAQDHASFSLLQSGNAFVLHPGQVSGFMADDQCRTSSLAQINQFGSYGLFINGIKAMAKGDHTQFTGAYFYRNFNHYREHASDYGHNLNFTLRSHPGVNSGIYVIGSLVSGIVYMPGSLTKTEFEEDPFRADPRAVGRNEQRFATRGKTSIGFRADFGKKQNHQVDIAISMKAEFIRRLTKEYKLINRQGFGTEAAYSIQSGFWGMSNVLSLGAKFQVQPDRTEIYENFSGVKSDQIEELKQARMTNSGVFVADRLDLIPDRLSLSLRINFDRQEFQARDEVLPLRNAKRSYQGIAPSVRLNYTPSGHLSAYIGYRSELLFPSEKQLEDSPLPSEIFNMGLNSQMARTVGIGINATLCQDSAGFGLRLKSEASHGDIDNEMISFEVYGEEYCRNAQKTSRDAFDLQVSMGFPAGFGLEFSYTFNQFTYRRYETQSLEADSTGTLAWFSRDYSGKHEPGIPVHDLFIDVNYDHPFGKRWQLFAKTGYDLSTAMWVDDANSERTGISSQFMAEAGVAFHQGHFEAVLATGMTNITNEIYADHPTINSADRRFYNAGAPRSGYCTFNIGYLF